MKTKSEPKEESKSKEEPKEEPEESVGTKFVKVGDNVPDITLLDQDEKETYPEELLLIPLVE